MTSVAAAMATAGLAFAISAAVKKASAPAEAAPALSRTNFPVLIHRPEAPRVLAGTNYRGEPVTISCATCHATTTPNSSLRDAAHLTQFHQGMKFAHGEITCVSCHNPQNYDTLRMADGTAIEFPNVSQLCGQCHGPQARDYRNGAHGGMNGFWDLTRGPRQRNTCTDCHDPHSPAYPAVRPVFKPVPAERGRASTTKQASDKPH